MEDIHVERKGSTIWAWIVGLIVLGLLAWALLALLGGDGEEMGTVEVTEPLGAESEPVAPVGPAAGAMPGAGIPVSEIVEDPAAWTGRTVAGEVRVVEVPTDRGFWIEDQGERLFVILGDAPAERPVDIAAGQVIRMSGASVRADLAGVPGDVDADTRRIVQGLPVFLQVDEANVEILRSPGA